MMQEVPDTDLLIIGAGPFGLALAAHAAGAGIRHQVVGEHMGFWRSHMPAGMYLRSDNKWHFDTANELTLDRYVQLKGLAREQYDPLPLGVYLDYCDWFTAEKGLTPLRATVERLDRNSDSLFSARFTDGSAIRAKRVVLALGVGYFAHVPPELERIFSGAAARHTRDYCDFGPVDGKRVLIVGGRQSAFEWTALMREHGAKAIHIVYRHDTPAFTVAEWDWVNELVDRFDADATWYQQLGGAEKDAIFERLFTEGRRKLEPWLTPRITHDSVQLHPRTSVAHCDEAPGGTLRVQLSDGSRVEVDEVLLATGYKADLRRIPFVSAGNLLPEIVVEEGLPLLDGGMQSSVPGLYFTSACATRSFGPFFGFTGAVRASARMIVNGLTR